MNLKRRISGSLPQKEFQADGVRYEKEHVT